MEPYTTAKSHPLVRKTALVVGVLVLLCVAWVAGVQHGKQSALAAATSAARVQAATVQRDLCHTYFGNPAKQFSGRSFSIDTAASTASTSSLICAYKTTTSHQRDALVLFLVSAKPKTLLGKDGVRSSTVVQVGQVWAIAASTTAKMKVTSRQDTWLSAAAKKAAKVLTTAKPAAGSGAGA